MWESAHQMTEPLALRLFELVDGPLCLASDDGQRVHDQIASAVAQGRKVRLSFANVTGETSAFLNAAVGQLHRMLQPEQIRASLSVEDIEPDDLALPKRVADRAKEYSRDPERFEEADRRARGYDGED